MDSVCDNVLGDRMSPKRFKWWSLTQKENCRRKFEAVYARKWKNEDRRMERKRNEFISIFCYIIHIEYLCYLKYWRHSSLHVTWGLRQVWPPLLWNYMRDLHPATISGHPSRVPHAWPFCCSFSQHDSRQVTSVLVGTIIADGAIVRLMKSLPLKIF